MHKLLIPFYLFLTIPMLLLGQVATELDRKGKFGIQGGWTQLLIGDQHASPLLYTADALNIGAIYRNSGAVAFELALNLKVGTNQARRFGRRIGRLEDTPDIFGNQEIDEVTVNPFFSFFAGNLRFRALWPLGDRHKVGVSFNARHIYTGLALDDWHYSQLDIAPEYQFFKRLFNGDLQVNLSLPLLAGVLRPNYAFDPSLPDVTSYLRGYLKTSSKVTSLNDLLNPRIRLGYQWYFNNGKEVGLHYHASWTSYPDPRPVRMFENGIDLTYFF